MPSSRSRKSQSTEDPQFVLHEDIVAGQDGPNRSKAVLDAHQRLLSDRPSIDFYLHMPAGRHRFPSIACYDRTRFTFKEDPEKFYHASWVDGFSIPKAYLLATAPHDQDTCRDFWHMIVSARPYAIVLMDEKDEGNAFVKRFWPNPGCMYEFNNGEARWIKIQNQEPVEEAPNEAYLRFTLKVVNYMGTKKTIKPTVFLMKPDDSTVPSFFPQLRSELIQSADGLFRKKKSGPVDVRERVVVVCGDGITKNSGFAVFDIAMDRAASSDHVGLKETTKIVKSQRWGAMGNIEQYRLLYGMLKAQIQPLMQRARRR